MQASPNVWGVILFLRGSVLWGAVFVLFSEFLSCSSAGTREMLRANVAKQTQWRPSQAERVLTLLSVFLNLYTEVLYILFICSRFLEIRGVEL